MAVITVDFDGTLYQGNSFKIMFKIARGEFTFKQWIVVLTGTVKAGAIGLFKGKNAFRLQFFTAFAKAFKGKTKEEMDLFFQELVAIGKKDVHLELVQKIREHQKKGDIVILLSGALEPFLKAFIKEVQLDDVHVISTKLPFNEKGVCSGEISQIINGFVKAEKVREWISNATEQKVITAKEANEIWAYADSESDIPLFQLATYPIVVNPNKTMKGIAEKNRWRVFKA